MKQRLRQVFQGEGLKQRVIRSGSLTTGAHIYTGIVRVAANLLLTRLLFPEAFGLMAIVALVVSAFQLLSDIGVYSSVIRSPRGEEPAYLRTAFSVAVLRGVILATGLAATAPLFAQFYGEELLAPLIQMAALGLLFETCKSMNVALAQRRMQLGRLVGIEVLAQAVGIGTSVLLAYLTGSIWALALGNLARSLTLFLSSYLYLEGPAPGFAMEREALKDILGFGTFIFFSTLSRYFSGQAITLTLTLFVSVATLGIYTVARSAIQMVEALIGSLTFRVLFPAYSERSPLGDDIARRRHRQLRRSLQAIFGAGFLLLALIATPLIELLYDPRYALAGPMLGLLACAALPNLLTLGYVASVTARGRGAEQLIMQATRAALDVTLCFAGAGLFGIAGAILGVGVAGILHHPIAFHYARRAGSDDAWGDAVVFALGLAGALLVMAPQIDGVRALLVLGAAG